MGMTDENRQRIRQGIKNIRDHVLDNPEQSLNAVLMLGCAYLGYSAFGKVTDKNIPVGDQLKIGATGALTGLLSYKLVTAGDPVASAAGLISLASMGLISGGAVEYVKKALDSTVDIVTDFVDDATTHQDYITRARALQGNDYFTYLVRTLLLQDIEIMPFSYDDLKAEVELYEGILAEVEAYVAIGGLVEKGTVDEKWTKPYAGRPEEMFH